MNSISDMCYNVPGEPIYGQFTTNSIKTIAKNIDLASNNGLVVDLGSGSCVTLCTLVDNIHGATGGVGIEVSSTRHFIASAMLNIRSPEIPPVKSVYMDLMNLESLPVNTSVVFSFDKAFVPTLLAHMKNLIDKCQSVTYVISTQKALLGWNYIGVKARTQGGQTFTTYVFKK